jgi:hypothetical protein
MTYKIDSFSNSWHQTFLYLVLTTAVVKQHDPPQLTHKEVKNNNNKKEKNLENMRDTE